MRKRFLEKLAEITTGRPKLTLFAAFASVIICIILSFNLKIETNVASLLPAHSKAAQDFQNALKDFGAFDFTLIVLEAGKEHNDSSLIDAGTKLAKSLSSKEFVKSVNYKLDSEVQSLMNEGATKWIVSLLTPDDFSEISRRIKPEEIEKQIRQLKARLIAVQSPKARKLLLEDPLDLSLVIRKRLIHSSGPTKLNLSRGYFISDDGKMMLIVLKPQRSSADVKFAKRYIDFLDTCKKDFFKQNPDAAKEINISYAGSHIEALNDAALIKRDFKMTMISSFFMVMILFVLVYKRFDSMLFVGLPLAIGIVWTIGIVSLVIGRLTIVTVAFAAILVGLGIDFAIHIYGRFVEEMLKKDDFSSSIKAALGETGIGIIAGATTTAFAFYGMLISSFNGFKELGFITGTGILTCMFAILITLPPLVYFRTLSPKGKILPKHSSTFFVEKLSPLIIKNNLLIIIGFTLITLAFAFYAVNIKFEEDIRKLKQPSLTYIELKKRLSKSFEMPSNQIIAITEGKTLQEALQNNDRLYSNIIRASGEEKILSVDSLRTYLPSIESQKASRNFIRSLDTVEIKNNIMRFSKINGLSEKAFEPFFKRLDDMKSFAENGEFIEIDNIHSEILQNALTKFIAKTDSGYKTVTHIYPPEGKWRNSVPSEYLSNIGRDAGKTSFTGVAIISAALREILWKDFEYVVILVLLIVFVLIYSDFKKLSLSILSTTPVVIGAIWLLGCMELLGIKINAVNIAVVPMIIGIGVDNGIHLIHRYYESDLRSVFDTLKHTGRSMVMCSLTTIFGFGSLVTCNFKGMREMGLVSILGVSFCLIIAIVFIPAVLTIKKNISKDVVK